MGHRDKKNKNNTSGCLGVTWSKEKGKWHAKLGVKYQRIHIGYFTSIDKASEAYIKAKKKFVESLKEKGGA